MGALMNAALLVLRRISGWLARLMQAVLVLSLAGIFLCVAGQIVARTLLDTTYLSLDDVVVFGFTLSIFSGVALVFRDNAHLATPVLNELLEGRWERHIARISDSVCLLALAALFLVGLQYTQNGFGQFSPVIGLPLGWVFAIVPVSAAASMIFIIERTFNSKEHQEKTTDE